MPALNFKSTAVKTGKPGETFTPTPKAGFHREGHKAAGVGFRLGLVIICVRVCAHIVNLCVERVTSLRTMS